MLIGKLKWYCLKFWNCHNTNRSIPEEFHFRLFFADRKILCCRRVCTKSNIRKWDTPQYQRISDVLFDDQKLKVFFQDGTFAIIEPQKVLPPNVQQPSWEHLYHNTYEIILPTENKSIEISWSTIRVLSDVQYSRHMAKKAEDQARTIGKRIKDLRERRGIKSRELAERAGIAPQSLSRIENGKHDVVYKTLRKILGAMDYSLKDLTEDFEPSRHQQTRKKIAASE